MKSFEQITLSFACNQTLDDHNWCSKCARKLVDFTGATRSQIDSELRNSSQPVCGIFQIGQINRQFLRAAGAVLIGASASMGSLVAQEIPFEPDSAAHSPVLLGMIAEITATPVGGFDRFRNALLNEINFPETSIRPQRCFVEFTIESNGKMESIKVIKGDDPILNAEIVRALKKLDYPFEPGTQRSRPVRMRMVMPLIFGAVNSDGAK